MNEFGREEIERKSKHSKSYSVFVSKVKLNLRVHKREDVRRRGGSMMGCKYAVQGSAAKGW
jgi:hypothetical protein